MPNGAKIAGATLEGGAAIGTTIAAVSALGTAAAAANAVPIAGQVAAAALGLAAMFTKIFAGKGPKGKKKKRDEAKTQARSAHNQGMAAQNTQQPTGQVATQAAPETQGYGQFQQMQQQGPTSVGGGQGAPQPGMNAIYGYMGRG